jgi:O-succinylbenzoic acid--CoA ligase
MSKPLKVLPSTDPVAALLALGEALENRVALHLCDHEHNNLPSEVADDVAVLVESSGSTGVPKMIEISAEALLASAKATEAALGGPGQWLLCLPTTYIAGLQVLVRSLLADTQPVLTNTSMPFTPEGFARAASLMKGERRYTSLVPAQLGKLASAAGADDFVLEQLRRFDAILVGGQAPNPNMITLLRNLGVKIVVTYGSTETAGGCVYDGTPLRGVGIGLLEDGRIAVSGPTLANGLLGEWQSNDLGAFDENGRLVVLGRADRVIISGGLKLSLDWVEQWVSAHQQVKDVVVLPLDNERFGQSFLAYVVYRSEDALPVDPEAAVQQFGPAASHAVWASLSEIPLLPNGKPHLEFLRQNFIEFQEKLRRENGKED